MNNMQLNQLVNGFLNNQQVMQNPICANAIQMYMNHNTQGLTQLAENLCRENGTTLKEQKIKLGFNN